MEFHDLRHTFASLMVPAGANPLQLAEAAPIEPGKLLVRIAGNAVPAFVQSQIKVGTTTYKHLDPEKALDLYLVEHLT